MADHFVKHHSHHGSIHLTKNNGPHYAALRCIECNKHIQWVNKLQVQALEEIGVRVVNKHPHSLEVS